MHTLTEIVRLSSQGLSDRLIARSVGLSRTTVMRYIERAAAAGVTWPLPVGMTESKLAELLAPAVPRTADVLDWAEIHQELCSRKFATLQLLWAEYGFGLMSYSTFCRQYEQWKAKLKLSMRKHYRGGEVLFVDFAGDTMPVTDPETGEVRQAHVFVAVLAASNFTFAEAVWREDLESWVSLVVKALEFIGGVPELVVSDNARTVVTKADRYDPLLHHLFVELSRHYDFALLPARPRKPKDKAKVEAGVKHVQQGILAKLEKRTFFSLHELNEAIAAHLAFWNDKPFQKLAGTRRKLFEEIDKPALKELPPNRYEFAEWRKAKVHIDYHIQVDKHFYSVPHTLVGREVDVRLTRSMVEVFYRGERTASHQRSQLPGRFSTLEEHMPMHHREHVEQNAERFVAEAAKIGPWAREFVEGVFKTRRHPQLGFRTCQGLLRLPKKYGIARVETACEKAVAVGAFAFRSLESLLQHNLEQVSRAAPAERKVVHLNIRGPEYYSKMEEENEHVNATNTGEIEVSQASWDARGARTPEGVPRDQGA